MIKIYIRCPDDNSPNYNVRKIYNHVDILNRNGIPAYVLHTQNGFRCSWFYNNTKMAYISNVDLRLTDILVFPEMYGPEVVNFSIGTKKVILNHNYNEIFNGYSINKNNFTSPYTHEDTIAAIVTSEDSKELLNYTFPKLKVYRIHNSINPKIFSFQKNKKKQISFLTYKGFEDATQVINVLKFRNLLHDYELVPIETKSLDEITKIIKDSLMYLNFNYQEGFGLSGLSAMATGCSVIGYHCSGDHELLDQNLVTPIEPGNIFDFAKKVEEIINIWEKEPETLIEKNKKISESVLKNYVQNKEEESIISLWKEILEDHERQYIFHSNDSVIREYSKFSDLSVEKITSKINFYKSSINDNDYNEEYRSSEAYLYQLLSTDFSPDEMVNRLNLLYPGLLEYIVSHSGKTFLDFGGGLGILSQLMIELGKDVTYYDIPGKTSKFAQWRFRMFNQEINPICCELKDLKLDKNFDIIFVSEIILQSDNPEKALEKLCKSLNSQGWLIILSHHNFAFNKTADMDNIKKIIQGQGLKDISDINSSCTIWLKE